MGMEFDLDYVENKTLELVTSGCIEPRQQIPRIWLGPLNGSHPFYVFSVYKYNSMRRETAKGIMDFLIALNLGHSSGISPLFTEIGPDWGT